tara:strand:+ start:9974 stop:10777 length:804 start_codon:yes stop_codon:yes gene_type:complete
MNSLSLKHFFERESSSFKKLDIGQNMMQTILLALFLLALIVILYTRLFITIEFEKWDVQKCNPKYIFYSGYIKQNPNSSSLSSTIDNFNECIVKFNNQTDNQFSKILETNTTENLRKNDELVNNHVKISSQKALDLQRKINLKNQEFQIKLENVKTLRETDGLQNEINKLQDIIRNIKEYAHSYLTYAMMHFAFKLKISEKDGSSKDAINSSIQCGDYNTDSSQCNSNIYCTYDDNECKNLTKEEFYTQEAYNINEIIKQNFGNNKL